MVIKLLIGGQKLDLFKDENINLNSSIADVSDITKNTTDFTKSFTVPASDNNNNIFKHYYNANIDGSFDARIKQEGSIELDGIPFKVGKFRLNGVKIKNGIPDSYNINFWGNLVGLKDTLKNDELSSLDLSAYIHEFSGANVKTGLSTSLFSGDIIYNLLAKKRFLYNSDPADNTQEETLSNIAFDAGADTGIIWKDLRPSIKLLALIEAIENKYTIANGYTEDLVFSRDFFGRSEFENLYMWLNNDAEELNNSVQINFDNAGDINTGLSEIDLVENFYVNGYPSLVYIDIVPSTGFESIPYVVERHLDGVFNGESPERIGDSTKNFNTVISDRKHTFFVRTESSFSFTATIRVVGKSGIYIGTNYSATMSEQSIDMSVKPSSLIPKLKTIDFLKGLFNMFKLVVIPQNDGTTYVNTLKSYYAEGGLINITDFANTNQYEVERGDILNEIFFKFSDGETLLNKQFKTNTGFYYGDSETYLYDDENAPNKKLLDGETLEFELPFEQVIYERLTDLFTNEQTNFQYGAIIDDKLEPTNVKPHIFYNISEDVAGKNIGLIDELGVKSVVGATYNKISHVNNDDLQDFSTVFSNEFNEWDGNLIENTLYSNYHQDYITSIFNIKRRNFTYTVKNFPLRLLTELSLNDVVQIKDNYYRIDKYDLNLLNGDIKFKLINSFDNVINGFSPDRTVISTDYTAKTESVYVINLGNYTAVKNDTGDGIGWVTVSNSGNNLYFAFDKNTSGATRTMTVTVTNNDTLQEFDITLIQSSIPVTFDNNIITFDNNILTWDSNI